MGRSTALPRMSHMQISAAAPQKLGQVPPPRLTGAPIAAGPRPPPAPAAPRPPPGPPERPPLNPNVSFTPEVAVIVGSKSMTFLPSRAGLAHSNQFGVRPRFPMV